MAVCVTKGHMPQPLVDLQPFCHAADGTHPLLESPWSRGSWTYATDGSILVRVPKRGRTAKTLGPPGVAELFKRHLERADNFHPLSRVIDRSRLPFQDGIPCAIAHRVFDGRFLRLIELLPNVQVAAHCGGRLDPMVFRFDSLGAGLLMPMREAF